MTKSNGLLFLILISILNACGSPSLTPTNPQPSPTSSPPTRTPFPPSPTPIPIAAEVNGEVITSPEYQSELARYKAAVDRELTTADKEKVIHNLINLTLLAQSARSQGFQASQEDIQSRISELDREDAPLDDWLARFGYTEESFQDSLQRSIAAAWMRDKIMERVPQEMEQIHAQQILLYEEGQAQAVISELQNGTKFAQLAKEYDPQTRGELGWFPPGYLTIPALDEVLFDLEPGQISDIIETNVGYHIIKVIDREENRPLDPDVRLVLQNQALHDWLDQQWNRSEITISISE